MLALCSTLSLAEVFGLEYFARDPEPCALSLKPRNLKP